jgi:hypothetical protein
MIIIRVEGIHSHDTQNRKTLMGLGFCLKLASHRALRAKPRWILYCSCAAEILGVKQLNFLE